MLALVGTCASAVADLQTPNATPLQDRAHEGSSPANQPGAESLRERFTRLIGHLNDPSWETRDRAFRELLDLSWVDLAAIEPRLTDPGLPPETRLRLELLAYEMFRASPRAGMGVGFGGPTPEGVEVGRTVPGFDAARVLEPGDVIIQANGHTIREVLDLQAAIVATDPGQMMNLIVLRGGQGKPVGVECRMGDYRELNNPNPIDERILRAAWSIRRRAILPEPQGVRVAAAPSGGSPDRAERPAPSRDPNPIAPAGVGRGGVDRSDRIRVRVMGRDLELPSDEAVLELATRGDDATLLRVLIAELEQSRPPIRARLMHNQAQIRAGGLDPERLAELRAESAELEDRLQRMEEEIRALWTLWESLPGAERSGP